MHTSHYLNKGKFMKILEAITKIDTLKPNSYSQGEKIKWLSTLDGIIKTEIVDTHEKCNKSDCACRVEGTVFNGYGDETSLDTELLVPSPYCDIYIRYLEAQIDYANAEYGKYNNAMSMYNSAYSSFERYYNRTHMPKGSKFKFF